MNTNKLQSFAAEARTSLMKAVRARIDAALEPNSLAQSDSLYFVKSVFRV